MKTEAAPVAGTSTAQYLRDHFADVLRLWEARARQQLPGAADKKHYTLIDSLPQFLHELANSLETNGLKQAALKDLAEGHAAQRASIHGYTVDQVHGEYTILRQVLLHVMESLASVQARERDLILDFVDEARRTAAVEYTRLLGEKVVLSEERLSLAVEGALLGVFDWDLKSSELIWSDLLQKLWGYLPGEFKNDIASFWARIHPEDHARVQQAIDDSFSQKCDYQVEYRVMWPDGSIRWVYSRGHTYLDAHGVPARMSGTALDITSRILSQAKLAESESRYRLAMDQLELALDSAQMGTWRIDLRNHTTFTSESTARIVGAQGLTGNVFALITQLTHPEDRDEVNRKWQEAVYRELPYYDEFRIVRPDGALRWIFSRGNLQYDEAGQPAFISGVLGDITDRKALESKLLMERQNFVRLFEHASGFVAVVGGDDFVYEYVNATHHQIVGADVTGVKALSAVPDLEGSGVFAVMRSVYQTGEPETIREVPVRIGGQARYFNATYVARRNWSGEIDGVMALGTDLTESVLARRAVEDAVHSLQLERAMREQFVAALTHDLRTPLAAAKMSAQMLAKKASDAEAVQRASGRIVDNMDRADNMIRDLLDANHIKAGGTLPIDVLPCVLNEVVTQTLEELGTIHGDRFVLRAPAEIAGYWSRDGVRRVLENLCQNAIKYGVPKRPVTVSLVRNDDRARIEVYNEGAPISEADQPKLFKAFTRTEAARAGGREGWGLGLTLVRGIAEAHGGGVMLATHATGNTFIVELPLDARQNPPSA